MVAVLVGGPSRCLQCKRGWQREVTWRLHAASCCKQGGWGTDDESWEAQSAQRKKKRSGQICTAEEEKER